MSITATDDLRMRMAKIKGEIPKPYISIYEFKFGKLSEEEKNKVRNVYNLRITDETILKNFETIAKQTK